MDPEDREELDQLLMSAGASFDLEGILFQKQLSFVRDPSSFATGCCSRRAGKTVGVGSWLLEGPLENSKAPSLYITLTRGSAKRNIWGQMLGFNRVHNLGFDPNESELILKRNGVGSVYLVGADKASEIEKIRGTGWGRVVIDEGQSFPARILKPLIEDVLMPSFMDHGGQLRVIGSPGPVPSGYYYGLCQSAEWSHHYWTVWDNPHIAKAKEILEKVLKVRGVTLEDPGIQREWFGRWAYDPNSLVFRWDASGNGFRNLPTLARPWSYVIGVDLGWDDADAIAVLAYNEDSPNCYLVEEWVGDKQTITQLQNRLRALTEKYETTTVVMDTGGLGKKIAEEMNSRGGVGVKAAEKSRKNEYIELLNDALRSKRFFAPSDSRFAQDAMLVEWDKSNPEKPVISDRFHSDICDAVLYAYRESLHYLHEPPEERHELTGDEIAKQLEDAAETRWRDRQEDEYWM